MFTEIWDYLLPIGASVLTLAGTKLVDLWFKPKTEKIKAQLAVKSNIDDMDEKEIERERERANRAWARNKTLEDRIDELIKEAEQIRSDFLQSERVRYAVECERDLYKGLLGKLVKVVATCCPKIDLTEYKKALKTDSL